MAEDERSMGAILKDIVGNLQQIVQSEIRLAKVEVRQEVAKARRGVTLLVIGGALAVLALGLVLSACVALLSTVIAPWMAALLVALAAGGLGAAVIAAGLRQMQRITITPPRTVAAIEENLQWTKIPTR